MKRTEKSKWHKGMYSVEEILIILIAWVKVCRMKTEQKRSIKMVCAQIRIDVAGENKFPYWWVENRRGLSNRLCQVVPLRKSSDVRSQKHFPGKLRQQKRGGRSAGTEVKRRVLPFSGFVNPKYMGNDESRTAKVMRWVTQGSRLQSLSFLVHKWMQTRLAHSWLNFADDVKKVEENISKN